MGGGRIPSFALVFYFRVCFASVFDFRACSARVFYFRVRRDRVSSVFGNVRLAMGTGPFSVLRAFSTSACVFLAGFLLLRVLRARFYFRVRSPVFSQYLATLG